MSDAHRRAAMRGMTHTKVPENVAVTIRQTTTGDADLDGDSAERELAKRRLAMRSGKSHVGAFDKLCSRICDTATGGGETVAKAQSDGGRMMPKMDMDRWAASFIRKSLARQAETRARMAANHGGPLAKSESLTAGYGTDSATLSGGSALREQSLEKKKPGITFVVKPKTQGQQLAECMKALQAHRISGAEAQHAELLIQNGKALPADLAAKVAGRKP